MFFFLILQRRITPAARSAAILPTSVLNTAAAAAAHIPPPPPLSLPTPLLPALFRRFSSPGISKKSVFPPPENPPIFPEKQFEEEEEEVEELVVNEVCRLMSDYRAAHHDLESALTQFHSKQQQLQNNPAFFSPDVLEQCLKRSKYLPLSSFRIFIWASSNLKNFKPTIISYRILILALGATKQFPLIWDFVSEMRSLGREFNSDVFWVIFRVYAKESLPNDAIRAFRKMPDFGFAPKIEDLDQLVYSLCKKNLVTHAQNFYDEVKSQFPVTAKTYSMLIDGWGEIGKPEESIRVFKELVDYDRGSLLDVAAFNALLGSLCGCGKIEEAYKVLHEMGSKYSLAPNAGTYGCFLRAYCDTNDFNSALILLDRMKIKGLIPNVFTHNSVIGLLCENEMIDEAYCVLHDMAESGLSPDVWSYNAILAVHCERREVNRALRVLKKMDKEGVSPDKQSYNMVLKVLLIVGRIDRAMELWDGMEERGFYPSVTTYAVMVHGLCKKRRAEDACRYFEIMIDEGVPPYACTCEFLRDFLVFSKCKDRIKILCDKMRRSSCCSIQELSSIMNVSSAAVNRFRRKKFSERSISSREKRSLRISREIGKQQEGARR